MSLCVYALAARSHRRIAATGVTGEPVRRIRLGGVDVLIGEMTRAPKATLAALTRYDRLIASEWRRGVTLLPVRFGTVMRDRAELEALLRGAQPAITRQLAAVRNRGQMTLRVLAPAARSAAADPATRAHGPHASSGRRYLQQQAAQVRSSDIDPLRAAVIRWVRAERVEQHERIVTVYHLIPRAAAGRYRGAITRAAAAAGVRAIVSGPYPPYAFSW